MTCDHGEVMQLLPAPLVFAASFGAPSALKLNLFLFLSFCSARERETSTSAASVEEVSAGPGDRCVFDCSRAT